MYHFRLKWKRYTVCTNWWDSNFFGVGLPLLPVGLLLFARWESWTPVFKILVRALGLPSEWQTFRIQIRPDILSGLIWIHIVCKGYQQTTQIGKELKWRKILGTYMKMLSKWMKMLSKWRKMLSKWRKMLSTCKWSTWFKLATSWENLCLGYATR